MGKTPRVKSQNKQAETKSAEFNANPVPSPTLALSPVRSLLIRLEHRVPIVVEQFGLAILLVGIATLTSVLYLQSSVPAKLSQAAQIYGSVISPLPEQIIELPGEVVVPDVNFSFTNNLVTVHPVTIKASAGTKMKAFIQSRTSGLEIPMPLKSESIANRTWVFEADVRELPPGEYRFVARTYLNDIWYDESSNSFILQPPVEDETGESIEQTRSELDSSLNVDFAPIPEQISGQQVIILQVTDVEDIKIIIKSSDNKVVDTLSPSSVNGIEYKYNLDTRKYPDGMYTLEAKFYTSNAVEYVPGPTIAFKNKIGEPVNVGTSSISAQPVDSAVLAELYFTIKNVTPSSLSRHQTFEFSGDDLTFVEVHVKSQAQTSPVFSGLAIRQSDEIWRYSIDTATLPKGKYQVVAKYKRLDNVILSYVGPSFEVSYEVPPSEIGKPVTITPIQESVELIDPIVKEVQTEMQKPPVPVPYQPTVNQAPSVASDGEEKTINFDDQDLIDTAINQYTAALRSNDPDAINKAKNRALSLGVELAFDENGGKFPGNNSDMTDYLEDLIGRAERIEAMVKERTENKISQDTDNDGITDYDEVTLYKTNPMQPDSDADGFNDGAEILAGFNPLNSETESAVIFESPKEAGITRADILSVDSIVAILESVPKEDGVSAQAEISGRGLSNSFVTLFIYSTPVVVTLKTEDDGSWVYTFDKELEDGEHEVYVGVTDNAGVIVAKSNPFRFIKEAQAFTPADELTDSFAQEPTPRGVDGTLWQAAIFGLIVFIVGLILILLGKQLEHSKQANIANES